MIQGEVELARLIDGLKKRLADEGDRKNRRQLEKAIRTYESVLRRIKRVSVLKKTIAFSNHAWISAPIELHQDHKAGRLVKVVVSGSTGWVSLYPVDGSATRFVSEGERERTIIDFETHVYLCPDGSSVFRIEDAVRSEANG